MIDIFHKYSESGLDKWSGIFWCILVVALTVTAYRIYIRRALILSANNQKRAFGHGIGIWRLLALLLVVSSFCILFTRSLPVGTKFVDGCSPIVYYSLSWGALFVIGDIVRKILRSSLLDNKTKDKLNSGLQALILLIVTILVLIGVAYLLVKIKDYGPVLALLFGWIFQDYLKGIISYCHLRQAGLLHFGDWIIVKKYEVSGMIIDCTLLTITVRNWDNTISSIPMYSLQAESFQNNQEMLDGKTTGRRMLRDFVIDTSTIHILADDEKQKIEDNFREMGEDTITLENAKPYSLNISLFRLYLRHWLMSNDDVCRFPRLIVSLKEPQPEGVPLEIYVFITKTSLAQFELVQSEIEEHVIKTMQLFGLRLYQRLSAYDVVGGEHKRDLINGKDYE